MTFLLPILAALAFILLVLFIAKRTGLTLDKVEASAADPNRPNPADLCRLRSELMSPAERSFFGVLRAAASDRYGVLAKVRVGDILHVPGQGSTQTTARNKIQQKHADFVLVDPDSTKPLLIIELDDRSHQRSDRKDRDAFLDRACSAANLPILHVKAAHSYAPAQLSRDIEGKLRAPEARSPVPDLAVTK